MGEAFKEYDKIVCHSCQGGKQRRTSTEGQTVSRQKEGILSAEKPEPGDLVFSDQYESSVPGRFYNIRGQMNTHHTYSGGTIFYDAATRYISLFNQIGFTTEETIECKIKIERDCSSIGIIIEKYCTDNSVYVSKAFEEHLEEMRQTIQHSGVGGHHHNAHAENAIKIVTQKGRTMMFHSALCWPEHTDLKLWPLALKHAEHLHNEMIQMDSGLAPIELWTKSKSSYSSIQNAHTWGCPVFVLDPTLQDGKKIPKWQPRAQIGQYVGASPNHASSVGLVRNLRTNNISPQYHLVYDDFFETVHSRDRKSVV